MIKGKIHMFGDGVSTDLICPGRYYHLRGDLPELAKHALEDADKDFVKNMKPGDIVAAGENFGCGSSREHAAIVIKLAGASCVIAKQFARIFFRNCINIGLPAIEIDTSGFESGDETEVDLKSGVVKNLTKGIERRFPQLPEKMIAILNAGGLVNYIKENSGL
ncbi:MAG: 3-isopropylmalate dehydratase small subunit [Elusimicrobiota bacterium]|nr:3-isopropylmalate dehydratase small subunit [Elusimicrobiota bacterium]